MLQINERFFRLVPPDWHTNVCVMADRIENAGHEVEAKLLQTRDGPAMQVRLAQPHADGYLTASVLIDIKTGGFRSNHAITGITDSAQYSERSPLWRYTFSL